MFLMYYDTVLSRTFTTVDGDMNGFRYLVIKMALYDATPSSTAVLYAIFALSAFRLYGPCRSIVYKVEAINALSTSVGDVQSPQDSFRNLAASMLLCLYEIFDTSDLSGSWTQYLCGAKKIAKAVYASTTHYDGELRFLLDWVFYHDALAKFSLRHWTQKCVHAGSCENFRLHEKPKECPFRGAVVGTMGCSLDLMTIISTICDFVLPGDHLFFGSQQHIEILNDLEQQLLSIEQVVLVESLDGFAVDQDRSESIAELYRLAALIYLNRVARNFPSDAPIVEQLVEDAIFLIEKLGVCERPWPLFVVACEARSDTQRSIIAEAFIATQRYWGFANVRWARQMVEAAWKQDDLHSDQEEIDSLTRYNAIISAFRVLPTFA